MKSVEHLFHIKQFVHRVRKVKLVLFILMDMS